MKITDNISHNLNIYYTLLLLIDISNMPTINQALIDHTKSDTEATEVDYRLAVTAFQKRITCQQGVKSIVLAPDPAYANLLELVGQITEECYEKKRSFSIYFAYFANMCQSVC